MATKTTKPVIGKPVSKTVKPALTDAQKEAQRLKQSQTTLVSTKKKIKTDIPLLDYAADIDPHEFDVTAPQVEAGQVDLTDPNFKYDQVKAGTLANRSMTAADYTMIDPADVQNEFGDITRSEMRKNAAMSSELALNALDTELEGLLNYAPTAANLQRQQVALDNTTNQAERLKMLEQADPNIQKDLNAQRERFGAYAEGRVPDSILDRQLELGIQSRAADSAATGGFGKGSSAAMKAGQLMSAEQRIALSQYGDQALSQNIGQRTSTLVADQQYATGGSQISVMPSQSAGQMANAIASEANQGNITAKDALESKVQQSEYVATNQQEANKTNLLVASERDANQAQLDLQAATTNVDNDIRTQIAGKELNSAERRFNVELKTNTAIANADRAFQASNANAGRGLETATSNRAVKLEVDKTNKTLVFQDEQRKKSESFTAGQNAASRAASASIAAANRAASASANAASLAAQQAEADKDRVTQKELLDLYYKNRGQAQDSSTAGSIGNILTKAPDIIGGISKGISLVSNLLGGSSTKVTAGDSTGIIGGLFGL